MSQWDEVKQAWGKTVVYSGTCPHCSRVAGFYQSPLKGVVNAYKSAGLSALGWALNPKKAIAKIAWNLASKPIGEHASCGICERAVLKCPKCQTINSDEHWPVVCAGCGKELAHR